jgi:hypothetical protein
VVFNGVKNMTSLFRKLWLQEEAQDIAEYAVMLAVILVIVVGTKRNALQKREEELDGGSPSSDGWSLRGIGPPLLSVRLQNLAVEGA